MDETRKRVLLVATVQSHIGQFHKPLMQMLKENGWEIHVAARNNLDEKNGLQLEYPDKIYDVPFQRSPVDRRNIAAYKKLKAILAENHYDVIHCNTPVGGVLGRLAAKKYRKNGTQVYYTAHGFHFYHGAPIQNWLLYYPVEKCLARVTDKLITINEEDYCFAKNAFSCPVYHIHGVGANSGKYYPLNVDQQEELKKKLGLSGHIIVNVGELLPNKNQKTAILAIKSLREKFPDVYLLIAGNGPERSQLEQLVEQEGLTSAVSFLGYTLKLNQYFQVCDAEIACSYREGMPLNVIEAMLCGKPVAASKNRGHNELIQNGVNGYLVDADDVEAYAQSICQLLDNRQVNKETVRESIIPYTDDSVRDELKKIYLNREQL